MRLPEPSGEGRRRSRGLDPGYREDTPASYQSTSYGQSSYGPTSYGQSSYGPMSPGSAQEPNEEILREVIMNQRRLEEEMRDLQSRMEQLEQRVPGGNSGFGSEFCPSPQGFQNRNYPQQQNNGYDQGPYGQGPRSHRGVPQQQRSFDGSPGGPPYGGLPYGGA